MMDNSCRSARWHTRALQVSRRSRSAYGWQGGSQVPLTRWMRHPCAHECANSARFVVLSVRAAEAAAILDFSNTGGGTACQLSRWVSLRGCAVSEQIQNMRVSETRKIFLLDYWFYMRLPYSILYFRMLGPHGRPWISVRRYCHQWIFTDFRPPRHVGLAPQAL